LGQKSPTDASCPIFVPLNHFGLPFYPLCQGRRPGKTTDEIRYALQQQIAWFNVENVAELRIINDLAHSLGCQDVQIALRLNPDITANTHPYIATGHGGAKFGLTPETITQLLARQEDYPQLRFAGIHIHIGSQLGDTQGTVQAVQKALDLIRPYPQIRTVNIGGGMPAQYGKDNHPPTFDDFAQALESPLKEYTVLLEPGRAIIADAGILLTQILYVKEQAGQRMYITDASMSELIRPALYRAHHDIVPVYQSDTPLRTTQVVGPVCETADVLGRNVLLPILKPADGLAILTAGAYGMVMASNYNARPRPAEVVVSADGKTWHIARHRETWDDLLRFEDSGSTSAQ